MERHRRPSPKATRPRPPLVDSVVAGRARMQPDAVWDCAYFPPAASDAQIARLVDEITRALQQATKVERRWGHVDRRSPRARRSSLHARRS